MYIAHADDWKSLAPAWWAARAQSTRAVPAPARGDVRVDHERRKSGDALVAALSSYMVSIRAMSPTEAWAWIDDLATREGREPSAPAPRRRRCPRARRPSQPRCRSSCIFVRHERGLFFAKRRLDHGFFGLRVNHSDSTDAIIGGPVAPVNHRRSLALCSAHHPMMNSVPGFVQRPVSIQLLQNLEWSYPDNARILGEPPAWRFDA